MHECGTKCGSNVYIFYDYNIILEKFITHTIPNNNEITFEYLINVISCNEQEIKLTDHYKNKLYEIGKFSIKLTDNKTLLLQKSKDYINNLIRKYINPSRYKNNRYIYKFGKLTSDKYYNKNELDFINCIFYNFSKIVNAQIDPYKIQLVPPNELQNFNSINNYGFNKVTESIYNAILLKNLYAGDSIVPFIKNNYKNSHEILLAKIQSSNIYDYYFDANAKLRCDLSANYNLLIKNFLNLLLYDFYDYQAKELLLAKLCLNFGNIYTTTT